MGTIDASLVTGIADQRLMRFGFRVLLDLADLSDLVEAIREESNTSEAKAMRRQVREILEHVDALENELAALQVDGRLSAPDLVSLDKLMSVVQRSARQPQRAWGTDSPFRRKTSTLLKIIVRLVDHIDHGLQHLV